MGVFVAGKECVNENHPKANWNSFVYWPVFQLVLGTITDVAEIVAPNLIPGYGIENYEQDRKYKVYVRAMPCTTARLIGHSRGAKMVDYCIFVEPKGMMLEKVKELQERRQYINHIDFFPLRRRPIVLSAESKKPGEGFQEAQVQLGVWQAEQWALLETLLAPRSMAAETERITGQPATIPFLPALIVQGHEWYFTATTKSGKDTVCFFTSL